MPSGGARGNVGGRMAPRSSANQAAHRVWLLPRVDVLCRDGAHRVGSLHFPVLFRSGIRILSRDAERLCTCSGCLVGHVDVALLEFWKATGDPASEEQVGSFTEPGCYSPRLQ